MKCSDCKFWERHTDNPLFGFCKRNAPRPEITSIETGRKYQIIWPSTGKDDWCGQHEAMETLQ